MSFKPDAVIIEPKTTHKASVIWLHGLGADGHDFEPIVPELNLPADAGIRFIFPNAPVRPVTINGGMPMRAWYDVRSANLRELEDTEAITASSKLISDYIEFETNGGIASDKIILAGFSQGGAIALHTGLRYPATLAGILALSTYLPTPDRLSTEASEANKNVSITMAHGLFDPIIPVDQGRHSSEALKEQGYSVDWFEYTMEHAVCLEEIRMIGEWIKKQLT